MIVLDITDDLIPLDEAVIQRKRAKSSRYQTMSMDERREYNQKRRLRQLGLPENVNELEPSKLEAIKKHIDDVNARKAEAARQRYHRMVIDNCLTLFNYIFFAFYTFRVTRKGRLTTDVERNRNSPLISYGNCFLFFKDFARGAWRKRNCSQRLLDKLHPRLWRRRKI